MTHNEKVALVVEELTARGVGKGTIAPPAFRLAWKLGIAIPPPHFLSFGALAMVMGTFFGVLWGLLMWFAFWSRQGSSVVAAAIGSLTAGTLFGITMASYYRWKAGKLSLPPWSDYERKG